MNAGTFPRGGDDSFADVQAHEAVIDLDGHAKPSPSRGVKCLRVKSPSSFPGSWVGALVPRPAGFADGGARAGQ